MKRRHSQKRIKTAIFSAIAVASLGLLAGCELLVDFDRTLIDGGALGTIDATFDGSETFDAASNDASDATTVIDASDATTAADAGDSGSPQDAGEDADADAG